MASAPRSLRRPPNSLQVGEDEPETRAVQNAACPLRLSRDDHGRAAGLNRKQKQEAAKNSAARRRDRRAVWRILCLRPDCWEALRSFYLLPDLPAALKRAVDHRLPVAVPR